MRYVHRELEHAVNEAAKSFAAVVLTGPRRAGKTWLLQHLRPKAQYSFVNCEMRARQGQGQVTVSDP